MKIEIVVYEGFDEMDAVGPFEVLRNAQGVVEDLDVELVGADGGGEVVASHGLRVVVDRGLSGDADLVIVPGGGWNDRAPYGARRQAEGDLPRRLAELHDGGARIGSVCTGGMILAAAGLTDGRPATTHRGALDDLRASGADVHDDVRVVDDGDVLTSGGVTAGLDLALHVVEQQWGARLADGIAREMEFERDRRVLQRHG